MTNILPTNHQRSVDYIRSAGESIYYEITGSGTPVVLCHGLGGNHAIWWRQIETLAAEHTVVTWDQRGFGNSTADTGKVDIASAAGDLLTLLEVLGIEDAHVVGQSMGAFVALRAALIDDSRMESLTFSTSLVACDPAHTMSLMSVVGTRPDRNQHPVLSHSFSSEQIDLGILYNLISSFGAKPTSAMMLQSMADTRFTDTEIQSLSVPVSFIAAEHDHVCPPDVVGEARDRFEGASLRVLPGAGHSAYYEVPELWNQAVLDIIGVLDERP